MSLKEVVNHQFQDELDAGMKERLRVQFGEKLLERWQSTRVLSKLEVANDYRRQGHGYALLSKLHKTEKRFVTSVPFSNIPGLKLAKAVGLAPIVVHWAEDAYHSAEVDHRLVPQILFAGGSLVSDAPSMIQPLVENLRTSVCLLCSSTLSPLPTRSIALVLRCVDEWWERHKISRTAMCTPEALSMYVTHQDIERLSYYISPGCHVSLVADIWPVVSHFALRAIMLGSPKVNELQLHPFQKAALIGVGLQHKKFSVVAHEYDIPVDQIRIHFKLGLKRVRDYIMTLRSAEVSKEIEQKVAEARADVLKGTGRSTLTDELVDLMNEAV